MSLRLPIRITAERGRLATPFGSSLPNHAKMTTGDWIGGAASWSWIAALLAWRPLRRLTREMVAARARESFRLQRERLEARFFDAAAATGKPAAALEKLQLRSVDGISPRAQSGPCWRCVPVTIAFEAIEGGPMEGVEAVGNLRTATAVFTYDRGHWETVGKAVFNMDPAGDCPFRRAIRENLTRTERRRESDSLRPRALRD